MIEIRLSTLKSRVEEGKNLEELSTEFLLTRGQMTALLKEAGLKIQRKGYRLVNDMEMVSEKMVSEKREKRAEYILIEEPNLFN